MVQFEALSRFVSRVLKVFSFALLAVLVRPSGALVRAPSANASSSSSRRHHRNHHHVRTALAFQSEPVVRMRNADQRRVAKLPDNALSILEETRRILYSHRISGQRRLRQAQAALCRGDAEALRLQRDAQRRASQLDREIALVTQCMAALQPAALPLPAHLLRRIQLVLEVDFRDARHRYPVLLEDAVVPGRTAAPSGAAAPGRARRLSTYAFA